MAQTPQESSCTRVGGKVKELVLTHTAKVAEVVLSSLMLLILINPLVEVSLEEVNLLRLLEQAGPVGGIELLLAKLHLDIAGSVIDLARRRVNLGVELELDMVSLLEGVGVAGEDETSGLEVELEVGSRNVGDANGEVDEVALGVGSRRALGPENCWVDIHCQQLASLEVYAMRQEPQLMVEACDAISRGMVKASQPTGQPRTSAKQNHGAWEFRYSPSGVTLEAIVMIVV